MFDAKKTEKIHNWMKSLNDQKKRHFAINWRMAHTLFNVASKFYEGDKEDLQGIDWFKIYKSRDLGFWEKSGNRVNCF